MKRKILSLLLALCLVVGMVPVAASAETSGGTEQRTDKSLVSLTFSDGSVKYYETLGDAVAAVHALDTPTRMEENIITLLKDNATGGGFAVGYQSIDEGTTSGNNPANITFDLNTYTYSVSGGIGSSGTETNGFQFLKGSTVKIKNGTITSETTGFLIQNYSDLTLENVNLTATQASYVMSNNCGDVNITGNTSITAGKGKYAFDVCVTTHYPEGVTVNVNTTGTITGNIQYDSWDGTPENNQAKLNVQQGTFVGTFNIESGLEDAAKENFVITGGNFADFSYEGLDEFIPDGMEQNEQGEIVIDTNTAVASVNNIGYTTLQAAIDAAPAGATVTLLKGVELNGGAGEANGLITITKDIVLDGQNQFTIKAVDTVTEKTSLINIQNDANVTIKDLTLDGNGKKVRHGLNINDAGDVKVEKVTIKGCEWYAIVNNGTNLTIDGLTTDGTNGWGINVDENGTVTINNANIGEKDSIVYENPTAGFLTVNGGRYGNVILQAAETGDTVGGKVSLNKGTYNGVVTKGEGEENIKASKVVSVAVGTKFTNYTKKPVDGENNGNYIAIGDLLEEGLEVSGNGTVVEDKPYVPPVTPSTPTYANTVSDTENGKVTASPTRPKEGATVTITTTPDKGYEVGSVSVTDADGKAVAVTNAGNGKYTFKQPDSKVTIKVTFVWDNPFTDVGNAWYRNAIQYVYENNLMAGTGDTTFDPEVSLTRAMTAQILYNLDGQPKVDEEATFADMNEAPTWSVDAIAWAQDTGVVAGMGDNQFAPNLKVTREQFAQMMYNYAKYKKYDLTKTGDLSKFPDDGSVSDWAETAMSWANGNGLINGHEDSGLIDPAGNTIRGQAASIIMNFDKNVVK